MISGAWVRPGAAGQNSAVYMTIANRTGADDRLVEAAADVARAVEIHETVEENGVMRMRPVQGGLTLPRGGEVALKPGGRHVMLLGLTRELKVGDRFPLELRFEKAGTVSVDVAVKEEPATPAGHGDAGDHSGDRPDAHSQGEGMQMQGR